MDLETTKTPKLVRGQENVLNMQPGDEIEITKKINGVSTSLLEYTVEDGQSANACVRIRIEIDCDNGLGG